jgi:Tfp pilus assembly protein PilN
MNHIGICFAPDGSHVVAKVRTDRRSTPRVSVRRGGLLRFVDHLGFAWSEVTVAVACYWKKAATLVPPGDLKEADGAGVFRVCFDPGEVAVSRTILRDSMNGATPADMFLCSVPRHFLAEPAPDFVAVFSDGSAFYIGVTIASRLFLVFRGMPGDPRSVDSAIDRLTKYWIANHMPVALPTTLVVLGRAGGSEASRSFEVVHELALPSVCENDLYSLRALGAALSRPDSLDRCLAGPTVKARFRRLRFAVAVSSLLALALLAASGAACLAFQSFAGDREARALHNVAALTAPGSAIGSAIEECRVLEDRLAQLKRAHDGRSRWSEILQELQRCANPDIRLDRLATDPTNGNLVITLTGRAPSAETTKTFCDALQRGGVLGTAKVSSLERTNPSSADYQFRIICTTHQ